MSAPKGYSVTQIRLHWIVAGLIVLQLIFGEGIKDAFDIIEDGGPARYDLVTISHIAAGALVLAFAVWRLALRARRGVPALP
ncbi:MAG: cytochrome b/b6 domain-containing protein, partial [Pseudomonadota bacterium]